MKVLQDFWHSCRFFNQIKAFKEIQKEYFVGFSLINVGHDPPQHQKKLCHTQTCYGIEKSSKFQLKILIRSKVWTIENDPESECRNSLSVRLYYIT